MKTNNSPSAGKWKIQRHKYQSQKWDTSPIFFLNNLNKKEHTIYEMKKWRNLEENTQRNFKKKTYA